MQARFYYHSVMQELITGSNIFTIDALYHLPELAAIHLIRSKDRIAIIDTGTTYSVPQVEKALRELGLDFSHVDGGASALLALCANAKLIVHPKGARHMIDPKKLIAGTIAVYGEQKFKELYGKILPIDASRIIEPNDGETIDFAGRPLLFLDTPGHANHHHCIYDAHSNSAFTGDTLGVAYQALREGDRAFMAPTTTPVQFNPEALHQSIDKVMGYNPGVLYPTHYSAVVPSAYNIAGLHEQIEDLVMLTEKHSHSDNFEMDLEQEVCEYLVQRCINELPQLEDATIRNWLQMDAKLNAQGLAFWWQYRRE